MGDLKVSETFQDAVIIVDSVTLALTDGLGAAVTCNMVRVSNGAVTALTVQGVGGGTGAYRVTDFTPNAAGDWLTCWAVVGAYTIHYPYKMFKVGGGEVSDLTTRLTAARAGYLDELDFDLDARLGAPAGASISADILVIDNFVDDLETRLTAARAGYLDELAAANIPADLDLVLADTNELQGDWVNGGRLDLLIDAIKARTDNHVQTRTFFSPVQAAVTIPAVAADQALPTVTIPNITGTIATVYAGIVFRMLENTNAGANKLNGAQEIQINKAGGAWTDAIHFVDDALGVAASTREGGTMIMGYTDVSATINVFNTTAQFQWDEAVADQASLVLNDVQTFVVITYY